MARPRNERIEQKQNYSPRPCLFFAQGFCKKGDLCIFSHAAQIQVPMIDAQTDSPEPSLYHIASGQNYSARPLYSIQSTTTAAHPMHIRRKPCFAWNERGRCFKGDACEYLHDPQVTEVIEENRQQAAAEQRARNEASQQARVIAIRAAEEALRIEAEATRRAISEEQEARQAAVAEQELAAHRAQQEAARQARIAEQEAARRVRELEQEARRVEIAKEEAVMTHQHVIFDFTVVTFRAGIAIQDVMTGFESCKIRVGNLPLAAKDSEVYELFTQQGIDPGSLHISGMNTTRDGKQEAFVLCREDIKSAVVIGLDGTEFGQERLVFQPLENTKAEGMRDSASGRSNILTISWIAPSASYVVTYNDPAQARRKVRELNQKMCAGRRVEVDMSLPQDACNDITIRCLPLDVTDRDVVLFSGSNRLQLLKADDFDNAIVDTLLQLRIESTARGHMESFDNVPTNISEGIHTIQARFDSWEQAKIVHDSFDKQRFWYIGNKPFRVRFPNTLEFSITVPFQQYRAQQRGWESLRDSSSDKQECNMRIESIDRRPCIIRIGGTDKKAIGSLKVRVENLAAGVKLPVWHRSLGSPGGQRFLQWVLADSGALVRNDWKSQALKAYGEPQAIEAAGALVEAEVERLKSLEQTIFLKRQSIGFFIRRGLAVLKEELGEDNVALNIFSTPCKVIIKGGEEARFTLNRLIEESLSTLAVDGTVDADSQCPICYDKISTPVKLGCGHTYCTGCLRHFLTSASETKIFPLVCMGDENNCGAPIPIPTIRRFLLPVQFNNLLESAFVHHIDCNPDNYQYCRTPDCSQVYRKRGPAGQSESPILFCPSCLAAVCTSCYEDAHEGLTCAEQKLQNEQHLTDELAMDSGFKKCPRCNIWTDKTEGCNHMECKCGAHFCWICVQLFDPGVIYDHMSTAHGGIYQADIPVVRRQQQPDPANRPQAPVPAHIGLELDDPINQFAVQERLLWEAAAQRELQQLRQELREQQIRQAAREEEQRRLAREEEQRRLTRNENQRRLEREEEQRRLEREEEQRRLAREEGQRRLAREEEQRRLEREYEQRRLAREEQRRLAREEEQKRLARKGEWQRHLAQVSYQRFQQQARQPVEKDRGWGWVVMIFFKSTLFVAVLLAVIARAIPTSVGERV